MNSCTICQLPVLELEGQFENLEPYYVEAGNPAADLAGQCHSYCVAHHVHGAVWHEWRVRNYTTIRGYRTIAEHDGWTVMLHKRQPELLAFHISGISAGGERSPQPAREQAIEDGVLIEIDEEFNLASEDASLIVDMKSRLTQEHRYPIVAILEVLGIADRVQWPQALEDAFFVLDRQLQREWVSTAIAARAHYAKFLPAALVPFWKAL